MDDANVGVALDGISCSPGQSPGLMGRILIHLVGGCSGSLHAVLSRRLHGESRGVLAARTLLTLPPSSILLALLYAFFCVTRHQMGRCSARRFRLANWRVCMIQCAGSQKRNSAIPCRSRGLAEEYPLTTSRVRASGNSFN